MSTLICLMLFEFWLLGFTGVLFWEARGIMAARNQMRIQGIEEERVRREAIENEDTNSTSDDFVADETDEPISNSNVKTISGGVINGKATNLPKPVYPPAARAVKATGTVNVQVTLDINGKVVSASALSGHPLLRPAAVEAARQARFAPTILGGERVKVTGIITYNFSGQ